MHEKIHGNVANAMGASYVVALQLYTTKAAI